MTTCDTSCLTCSSSLFNSCLTCSTNLTLSYGTCNCNTIWQTQCTGQYTLRQLIQFLDMFIKLYIVSVMLLYVLKIRLPLSYRIWSGLNGLSLLIYNQVFYLQYQDQLMLKSLAISNGPYFASFRVMEISTSHILPTLALVIIMIVLIGLLYFPFAVFGKARENLVEYLKNQGLHMFDCTYFFASKMMFFYIGKFIKESSTASTLYIAVVAVYGLFLLLQFVRVIFKYHDDTIQKIIYDTPIYLYTIMAPATMIGLAMATSQIILVILYCAPFGLLFLILLLNRNMKIFTKQNIKFFVIQLFMAGTIMAFIFLNNQIKTYILVAIILLSVIVITAQIWLLYTNGYDLNTGKVYPALENIQDDRPMPKKLHGQDKQGYF